MEASQDRVRCRGEESHHYGVVVVVPDRIMEPVSSASLDVAVCMVAGEQHFYEGTLAGEIGAFKSQLEVR